MTVMTQRYGYKGFTLEVSVASDIGIGPRSPYFARAVKRNSAMPLVSPLESILPRRQRADA
jgi:hypothetical protein